MRDFMGNRGVLLSGALAYYTLLSIVPMSILTLIGLSRFVNEEQLFRTLSTYMGMVIPGYGAILKQQVRVFLEHRHAVGIIGFVAMLFFSSAAFSVLENAMSVIFFHHMRSRRRHFLVSFIIPYIFIFSIGLGITMVSLVTEALVILEKRQLIILGWSFSFELPFQARLLLARGRQRSAPSHVHLPCHARGARQVPPCRDRGDIRHGAVGDHEAHTRLVFTRASPW